MPVTQDFLLVTFAFFLCRLLTPLSFVLDATVTVIARFSALSLLFGGVKKKTTHVRLFSVQVSLSPAKAYSFLSYHQNTSGTFQPDNFLRYNQEHTTQMVTAQTMHEHLVFGRRQTEQLFSIATSKE